MSQPLLPDWIGHGAALAPVVAYPDAEVAGTPEQAFVRRRRVRVSREGRLVVEGPRQHRHQVMERGSIIIVDGGADHGFHAMVLRDVRRVHRQHGAPARRRVG